MLNMLGPRPAALHGLFAVFKQSGVCAFEVVDHVKAILRDAGHPFKVRVGHGSSLDKAARGVLVIGVGEGCKQLSSFWSAPKRYRAVGKLGVLTDSLDGNGEVVKEMPTCTFCRIVL